MTGYPSTTPQQPGEPTWLCAAIPAPGAARSRMARTLELPELRRQRWTCAVNGHPIRLDARRRGARTWPRSSLASLQLPDRRRLRAGGRHEPGGAETAFISPTTCCCGKTPQIKDQHHVAERRLEAHDGGHAGDHDPGPGTRADRLLARCAGRADRAADPAGPCGGRARAHLPGGQRPGGLRLVPDQHLVYHQERRRDRDALPAGHVSWTASAPRTTPGLVLVHGAGNVFVRSAGPQGSRSWSSRRRCCSRTAACRCSCTWKCPGAAFSLFNFWALRYMWLRLSGPGRVAVQSAFEPVEDDGRAITSTSPITQSRW